MDQSGQTGFGLFAPQKDNFSTSNVNSHNSFQVLGVKISWSKCEFSTLDQSAWSSRFFHDQKIKKLCWNKVAKLLFGFLQSKSSVGLKWPSQFSEFLLSQCFVGPKWQSRIKGCGKKKAIVYSYEHHKWYMNTINVQELPSPLHYCILTYMHKIELPR